MNMGKSQAFLRGKRAQQSWIALVIIWACVRAFAINRFFGQHSVNPWGYLLVDLASSIPYAINSSRAIISFLDKAWAKLRRYVILSAIFFYMPDVYVFIFARTVPTSLYVGFAISIIFFSILAVMSLKKDAIKGKY